MTRFFSVIALAGLTAIGFSRSADSTRQALEKATDKFYAAFRKRDMSTLKSLITSDFKVSAKGKAYDRATWISVTGQIFEIAKFDSVSHSTDSVRLSEGKAILRTRTSVRGTITPPHKKTQTISDISVDDETWVKQGGVWKFKEDKTVTETTKLDGKIYKGQPSP